MILRPEEVRDPRQEAGALGRLEVPDRAAEEGDHARPGERDPLQVALEVADEAVHGDPILAGNGLGGVARDLLGDVDRRVCLEAAGLVHRVQEHAGLARRARAKLDQRRGAFRHRTDPGGVALEDGALGPGRVVLGKLGDRLEQLRAALVVEVARGELLEGLRQTGPHVRGHSRQRPPGRQVDVDGDLLAAW